MPVNCSHFEIIALNKSGFWISVSLSPVYATQPKCLKLSKNELLHLWLFLFLNFSSRPNLESTSKVSSVVGSSYFMYTRKRTSADTNFVNQICLIKAYISAVNASPALHLFFQPELYFKKPFFPVLFPEAKSYVNPLKLFCVQRFPS